MCKSIQVGNIIALELKTGAIVGAYSQNGLDILKRIFKNQITSTQKNFSGKQRRTSFDEMGGSDDLNDLNGNDNDFMDDDEFMND